MPEGNGADAERLPPHAQLIEMATAHWVSRIVYVAAKLGVADHLADGARSAEELAGPTGTHAPSLYRLMRSLANVGVLTETAPRRFALTPLGEALKTGAPGAARASVLTIASDWWVRGFGELLYSVQTGKSGFERSLGMPVFDWLAMHPKDASMFSETMIGFHGAEPPAVPHRTTSRMSQPWWTWVGPPATCWPRFSHVTTGYEGFSSISRMWFEMRPRCWRPGALQAASRFRKAASSTACRRTEMPTFCRTSSTIGTRSSASRFWGTVGVPCIPVAACSSWRWCFPRAIRRILASCSIS